MNSQCPPCSCLEEAAQSHPCAVAAPEQNSAADPCPCQDLCPSCPCDPPQVPLGVTSPSLPADSDPVKIPSSGEEPLTFETPGMCVMRFPLQKSILTVELCPPDSDGTFSLPQEELGVSKTTASCLDNLEKLGQDLPAVDPCTLEVVELGTDEPCQAQGTILGDPCVSQSGISMDPCSSQSGISMDPCVSQSGISMDPCSSQRGISTDPCSSQSQGLGDSGDAKDSKPQTSSRSPFRPNSCTSSIVERCLSRCQSWFRGKK